jgi:asparagine synthase (glutamine-hydrolysing)
MTNRGPDHRDVAIFEDAGCQIALLHSRLAILDLDDRASQPMSAGDCTVVFNGEIYNYVELRQELVAAGFKFRTDSDTEVLLNAYLAFGDSCVERFEGMWAFAIYDRRHHTLLLSRDRFAEKPLYYMQCSDGIYFGSEVKFIQALSQQRLNVNEKHILRFLTNGYKSLYKHRETFFEEIQELPAATNLVVSPDLTNTPSRYWMPQCAPRRMSKDEAIEGTRHWLNESLRIRLRADVPLAFCLSGGVDSAALTSIAAKTFNYDVTTFSICDTDERYEERDNIQATLDDLGCRHFLLDIPGQTTRDHLEKLVRYHDAPVLAISYCIHAYLSEMIAQQGFRVAVSGSAADELFTGYYDHFNLHLYEMRNHPDFEQYLEDWHREPGQFVRNPYLQNPKLYLDDPTCRAHVFLNNDVFAAYTKLEKPEPFSEHVFCDSLLRNRMLNELFQEVMPVILHEDDLNSMCYSIENRSPYLDSRLFEFAYSIPAEYLIQHGYGKHMLREAVAGTLNDTVRLDRHKKGFNASFASLFDLTSEDDRAYLLDDSPIFDLVRKDAVESLLQMNFLPNSYSKFLFNFISSKIFLNQWQQGTAPAAADTKTQA